MQSSLLLGGSLHNAGTVVDFENPDEAWNNPVKVKEQPQELDSKESDDVEDGAEEEGLETRSAFSLVRVGRDST